ncbi:hypothetical protein [Blastococcus sp. SYSU D00813]
MTDPGRVAVVTGASFDLDGAAAGAVAADLRTTGAQAAGFLTARVLGVDGGLHPSG